MDKSECSLIPGRSGDNLFKGPPNTDLLEWERMLVIEPTWKLDSHPGTTYNCALVRVWESGLIVVPTIYY